MMVNQGLGGTQSIFGKHRTSLESEKTNDSDSYVVERMNRALAKVQSEGNLNSKLNLPKIYMEDIEPVEKNARAARAKARKEKRTASALRDKIAEAQKEREKN
jgi:hypothetical protein